MIEPQEAGRKRLILLLIQCAWCGSVKVGPWFLPLSRPRLFVGERSFVTHILPTIVVWTTHCICPRCTKHVENRRHVAEVGAPERGRAQL